MARHTGKIFCIGRNKTGTCSLEQAIVSLPSTRLTASGPLLITHWGISGPAVLKLSSHAAPLLRDHGGQRRCRH